jgi:hypothetical protein
LLAWHLLFKYMARRVCRDDDHLLVAAGTLGTKAKKLLFERALGSVIWQHSLCRSYAARSWDTVTHPCLQVADYCTWAIHRMKEQSDARSYMLIQPQVQTYFEPFATSTTTFY